MKRKYKEQVEKIILYLNKDQLGRMGHIEMQKARRERTHPKHSTHHVKSLHGRPRVGMQLDRGHVKFPKDTGRESIKRKGHLEVQKKKTIHKKRRGFGR